MFVKSFISLALFVATLMAAPTASDRKCLPEKTEYFIAGKVAQSNQGVGAAYDLVGLFAADYSIGKEAIAELVYDKGQLVANFTEIRSKEVTFLVDNLGKECKRMQGYSLFQPCSDSPKLKHVGSWKLGTQMTDTYTLDESDHNRKLTVTMFRENFGRATAVIEQVYSGIPQLVTMQFGNETLGISHPELFNIPSFC